MTTISYTYRQLTVVIFIIGTIAAIAAPHFFQASRMAIAARVVSDFNTIHTATVVAYAETGSFPASSDWGQMPPGLVSSLSPGFKFVHGSVSYRWRRWCLPAGMPTRPTQKILLGLQVRTKDRRLLNSIVDVYQGRVNQMKKTQVTLVML